MKKKIIICAFTVLILVTATIFIVSAIDSYNYDIKNHSDDKWLGFGTVLTLMVGGCVVFYELDLFYTAYYFFVKPKTIVKSILNVVSNLTLLSIVFTDSIAHFLYKCVSKAFGEEAIVLVALFFIYLILRVMCFAVSQFSPAQEDKANPTSD